MADDAVATDRKLNPATIVDDGSGQNGRHPECEADSLDDDGETTPVNLDPRAGRMGGIRGAIAVGLVAIAALATASGYLGMDAHRLHQSAQQRAQFLRVGRQGALNLTTISYTDADGAVQRILDTSTGAFHEDFQKRSGPFVDVVKQTQSTTEGTVTEAALESMQDDRAQVLVAVSVRTTSPVQPPLQPHLWRMRITVQKVGGGAKMSDVAFVA